MTSNISGCIVAGYKIDRRIGAGNWGAIHLAFDPHGHKVHLSTNIFLLRQIVIISSDFTCRLLLKSNIKHQNVHN